MGSCLADEAIAELIEGRLGEAERADVHAHIDACEACRALVADAARSDQPEEAPLPRGATVGRYVVTDLIGAGAMGVVYGAWDPQLQRRIALKLLRPDRAHGEARLLREAQAMARVQHPNVVAVHDVGMLDDRVFVAMELVEGETLAGWLLGERRTWREVVAMFLQIGEGLAAAHAAELVHRDFKPDNVLVGADLRARVGDFGLAHATAAAAPAALGPATQLAGTPAYMAPEQLAGGAADARSDEFAFCLALYEALYGERPFAGGDLETLRDAIAAGEVRPAPAGSRVPARVRRVALRGLAADPAKRYPAMRPLLGALSRAQRGTAVRGLAVGAVAVVALVAATAHRTADPCDGAERVWGDVWTDPARAAVQQAFAHTGRASSSYAFAQVDRTMSAYRDAWIATERRVCEATRVRHTQAEPLLEARMQCLDDRRREAAALAHVLASADAALVDDSAKALGGLDVVEACATARASEEAAPDPRADALRGKLADAKALDDAGRYAQGLEVARAAVDDAHRIGDRALEAKLLYRRGHLEKQANAGAPEATLHAAVDAALAGRDDGTAADAWTYLTYLAGFDAGRRAEGERYAADAAAMIERMGGDDLREIRRLHYVVGLVYTDEQRLDEARAMLDRANALILRAGAPEQLVVDHEQTRGMLGLATGKLADAYDAYHRVRESRERTSGPDNPGLVTSLYNEAVALVLLGRSPEAEPLYRRALGLLASVGKSGNNEAFGRLGLARALRKLGRPAEALDEDRRAVAIYDAQQPPPGWIGEALLGQGEDLLALARAREAIAPLERSLAIRATPDADPEDRAFSSFALARALWDGGGERSRALSLARDARPIVAPLAEKYGAYHAELLGQIETWLASRPSASAN